MSFNKTSRLPNPEVTLKAKSLKCLQSILVDVSVCVEMHNNLIVYYLVSNMMLIYKLVFLMVTLVLGDKAYLFVDISVFR